MIFKALGLTEVRIENDGSLMVLGDITVNIRHVTYIKQLTDRCKILLLNNTVIYVKESKNEIMSKICYIGG